jgi:type II pantothenate kinase
MLYQLAIDFGGSNTKLLVVCEQTITQRFLWPTVTQPDAATIRSLIAKAQLDLRDITTIAVTGGRSRQLPEKIEEITLTRVGEIEAIGRGGLRAANLSAALVVSMGTGTAMVLSNPAQFMHMGGSAVGGGTLVGLGQLLLGTDDPQEISMLASQGDVTRVDLTVGDIIGGPVGRIPASFAASHFGKVTRLNHSPARADVAAGLCNLIGQALATTVLGTAAAAQQPVIVLTGQLIEVSAIRAALEAVDKLGTGNRLRVPPYPGFATALGALAVPPVS